MYCRVEESHSVFHKLSLQYTRWFSVLAGSEDIASGNEKLILGMIWLLIRHYQIGSQSKLPAKQMMHHWIRAVLHPHVEINNFNTDWNDGVALQ